MLISEIMAIYQNSGGGYLPGARLAATGSPVIATELPTVRGGKIRFLDAGACQAENVRLHQRHQTQALHTKPPQRWRP